MVHLAEEVGIVHRVGEESGGDARTCVPGGGEPLVDGGGIGRRDRDQAALVERALFQIREVEGTVANHGAAHAGAVLRL